MKFDWDKWNDGGKLIFVNACLAILSMFMNWSDIGIASRTGMQNGAVLCLGLWIYPVVMLLRNKPINLGLGLLCATLSFAFVAIYLIDMTSREVLGETVDVSAIGAWVFLAASFFLGVGVIRYQSLGLGDYREMVSKYVGDNTLESPSVLLDPLEKNIEEKYNDDYTHESASVLLEPLKKLKDVWKTIVISSILLGGFVVTGVTYFKKIDIDHCVSQIEYGDEYPFCAINIGDNDRYLLCVGSIDINRKYLMNIDASLLKSRRTNSGGYRIPFTAMNDSGHKLSKVAECDNLGRLLKYY